MTSENASAARPRVLVADPIAAEGIALLEAGAEVDVRIGMTAAELVAAIPDYQALVVRSETKVTAEVIAAADRLLIVARAGTGVDNVDLDAATQRGVVVVNAPRGNTIAASVIRSKATGRPTLPTLAPFWVPRARASRTGPLPGARSMRRSKSSKRSRLPVTPPTKKG